MGASTSSGSTLHIIGESGPCGYAPPVCYEIGILVVFQASVERSFSDEIL